jgi:Protein of unknown function (DUF3307)
MQPLITLALALSLAYFLGDFPHQSFHSKISRTWRGVAGRGLIHWLLILLSVLFFCSRCVRFSWGFAIASAVYSAAHLFIDFGKKQLIHHEYISDSTKTFLADQSLHGATLLTFAVLTARIDRHDLQKLVTFSDDTKHLILTGFVIYVCVMFAGGYLIRYMTKGLVTDEQMPLQESVEQLENAGMYIGWLERFLIVTAVVLRSPALIGLILTGKSIARFPEMKEPKFAEYFLIGTLLSFALALLGGLLLLKMWKGTVSLQP